MTTGIDYRELVDRFSEIIFIVDGNGKIRYINSAIEKFNGRPAVKLTGRRLRDIVFEADKEEIDQLIAGVLAGHARQCREIRFEKTGGELAWMYCSLAPSDPDSADIGLTGILVDISERKHLYEKLVRTEKLAATGQLAASVAHEINSPLQGINSLLSLIRKRNPDNKKLDEQLDLLHDAFERIRDTVKNLIDLNKPGRDSKHTINVNDVIISTVSLIKTYLRHSGILLTVDLDGNMPEIFGSPLQLGHVFMNMINNAAEEIVAGDVKKVTDSGIRKGYKGEIILTTRSSGNVVAITIEDTGQSVAGKHLDRIFDPFYTSGKKVGIGVGLSISRGIIQGHGGSIGVTNSAGGGAVFTIKLPGYAGQQGMRHGA